MNFKTYQELAKDVQAWSGRLPHFDLFVGVPRSGMLPALFLALTRNAKALDVHSFCEGIEPQGGKRDSNIAEVRKVLVVDDSVLSGKSLKAARQEVEDSGANTQYEISYGAVYVKKDADILYHEVLPMPRIFEWNWLHHYWLQHACMDIDGVLCEDPTRKQNDDGAKYLEFLDSATPKYIPTVPVAALVTSRCEKYRQETEHWLRRNGVKYKRLIMWPGGPKNRPHVSYKSEIYKDPQYKLFIESSDWQAAGIATSTGKPVLCTGNMRMYL